MDDLEQFYREFRDQVAGYLYHLSGSTDEVEELTQETFFQAILSLPRFSGRSSLRTWLFGIARRVFLSTSAVWFTAGVS